jgi:phosphoglycolate phosphatase-like HAD superfamily hydrolase
MPFELLNEQVRRGPYRAVLFDFDGTLSLIREGWPQVMIDMMVEILRDRRLVRESEAHLGLHIEHFIMALNGHPTIVQMERFAREIATRGGSPESAAVYLQTYRDRLRTMVQGRWDALSSGAASSEEWVVPNAHSLLSDLQRRGLSLYLASGTEREFVLHEANLLRVLPFFGEHVYAPPDDKPSFSKGQVVDRMLAELRIRGEELLAFGDGVVETQEVKRVGGTFIGVASSEYGETGVKEDKRQRLTAAGADMIIPDYLRQEELLNWLWDV